MSEPYCIFKGKQRYMNMWNINPSVGLNISGQITIMIENTDDFTHPRHSWLLVEGDLVKATDET